MVLLKPLMKLQSSMLTLRVSEILPNTSPIGIDHLAEQNAPTVENQDTENQIVDEVLIYAWYVVETILLKNVRSMMWTIDHVHKLENFKITRNQR